MNISTRRLLHDWWFACAAVGTDASLGILLERLVGLWTDVPLSFAFGSFLFWPGLLVSVLSFRHETS
jgi:hypothetical protein